MPKETYKYYIYIRDWKIIASSTTKQEWLIDVVEIGLDEWWHYRIEEWNLVQVNVMEQLNWTEFYVWIIDKELIDNIDREWEENLIKYKQEQERLAEEIL